MFSTGHIKILKIPTSDDCLNFKVIQVSFTIGSQNCMPQNGAVKPMIKVIYLLLTLPDMANKL